MPHKNKRKEQKFRKLVIRFDGKFVAVLLNKMKSNSGFRIYRNVFGTQIWVFFILTTLQVIQVLKLNIENFNKWKIICGSISFGKSKIDKYIL